MVNQKEENGNFQEQLTDLKKEKSVLSQMISATLKRSNLLNEELGHYWSFYYLLNTIKWISYISQHH